MALTDQQTQQFNDTGYLSPLQVAEEAQADDWREKFDALEAQEGREQSQVGLHDRHFDQPFIWEIATRPEILDAMESIIGPNILLLASQFFCKYGQGSKYVAWHQDVTYWGLEPPMATTAWYAVDRSDVENGCMVVVPGTHSAGIQEHGKADSEGNLLSINQEVPVSEDDEAKADNLILDAGYMSIHHGMLVHSSQPNRSTRRRCGLVLRYTSPVVKQVRPNSVGARYQAVLVRGKDRPGNFGAIARPDF